MSQAFVKINKSSRYQILATDRVHPQYGLLVSRTELTEKEAAVSIYSSGKVVIQCRGKNLHFDLETGKIDYA